MLINDLKGCGWIGIVYLLGLLFVVPLNLYLRYTNTIENGYPYSNYLNVLAFNGSSSSFVVILIMAVPVLTALLLFRYLQNSKAADMVHALPIRRATLYNTHLLAGLILLFVPVLITGLAAWSLVSGLAMKGLSGQDVLVWLSISLLLNLLFFMTAAAAGMITGISIVQGVLTYILLLLPTGLSVLLLHNLDHFIYGFAFEYYVENVIPSPLLRMMEFTSYPIHRSEIAAYLLISLLLYGAGLWLYQRRALERAGNAFAFDILYPIFKYGVAFCFMLLAGSYLNVATENMGWTYIAYFLGSLLAYIAMEMLLKKSLYVFSLKTFKGYGVFAVVMVLLLAGLQADVLGLERKIPPLAEVESVYMDYSFYPLTYRIEHLVSYDSYRDDDIPYPPVKSIYRDQANINSIHALQQIAVENREAHQAWLAAHPKAPGQYVSLAFTLKNGAHFYRQYILPAGRYDEQFRQVMESREYKNFHYEVLAMQPANVDVIEIQAAESNRMVTISDPKLIRQAVGILQQETLGQRYADMKDQRPPWANIVMRTRDHHQISLEWSKCFDGFEQWLQGIGQYEQARIMPAQDLAYAVIVQNTPNPDNTVEAFPVGPDTYMAASWEGMPGSMKTTDSSQLEVYLQNYTWEEKPYKIAFVLKNGRAFYGYLPADALGCSLIKQ